jgi:hypothetical protein
MLQRKDVYRCNHLKYRSKDKCAAVARIVYKEELFDIEYNEKEHSCGKASIADISNPRLSEKVKSEIRKLFIARMRKPSRILRALRAIHNDDEEFYETEPTRNQIRNILKNLRKEFNVDGEISLKDLDKHLSGILKVPQSEDEAFVIGKHFVYAPDDNDDSLKDENSEVDDERSFWFLMSTKRLLNLAAEVDVLCADATFKFVWLGYPALLFGTVDKRKQFHPLAFGITSKEGTEVYAGAFKVLLKNCSLYCTFHASIFISGNSSKCDESHWTRDESHKTTR